MEINALWTAGTALAGAAIKPIFDYASGHAQRKSDRIKALEERCDEISNKLEAKREAFAAQAAELLTVREHLDQVSDKVSDLEADNGKLREANDQLRQQLEEGLADSQAVVESLQGELAITQQHVADLTEQLELMGAEPRPRPKQPQDPVTGKFVAKSAPLKGKKP